MTPLVSTLNNRDRLRLSFRARGTKQEAIAALAGVNHSHANEVFNNKPGVGLHTRKRLFPHLKPDEIRLLGWTTEYDAWRSTHCSTENNFGKPNLAT